MCRGRKAAAARLGGLGEAGVIGIPHHPVWEWEVSLEGYPLGKAASTPGSGSGMSSHKQRRAIGVLDMMLCPECQTGALSRHLLETAPSLPYLVFAPPGIPAPCQSHDLAHWRAASQGKVLNLIPGSRGICLKHRCPHQYRF